LLIPNPDSYFLLIPDPGVKKAPDSESRIRNTAFYGSSKPSGVTVPGPFLDPSEYCYVPCCGSGMFRDVFPYLISELRSNNNKKEERENKCFLVFL
jgi:hypothetical protein